jgi:hypothetical protein
MKIPPSLETVAAILGKLPPGAVPGFIRMLRALLNGQPDQASALARLTAETLAAKAIVKKRFAK